MTAGSIFVFILFLNHPRPPQTSTRSENKMTSLRPSRGSWGSIRRISFPLEWNQIQHNWSDYVGKQNYWKQCFLFNFLNVQNILITHRTHSVKVTPHPTGLERFEWSELGKIMSNEIYKDRIGGRWFTESDNTPPPWNFTLLETQNVQLWASCGMNPGEMSDAELLYELQGGLSDAMSLLRHESQGIIKP